MEAFLFFGVVLAAAENVEPLSNQRTHHTSMRLIHLMDWRYRL